MWGEQENPTSQPFSAKTVPKGPFIQVKINQKGQERQRSTAPLEASLSTESSFDIATLPFQWAGKRWAELRTYQVSE